MRSRIAVALVALSLLAPGTEGRAAPPQATVRIQDFAYAPATIRVKPGAVVEWVNEDAEPHTVTADGEAFRSRALDTGQRFTFGFERKGTFEYHCALHPQMTGTVVVE